MWLYLLNCFHQMVLVLFPQRLYLLYHHGILLAVYGDGQCQTAQDQSCVQAVLLCHSLQVRYFQAFAWLVQDVDEVLGH